MMEFMKEIHESRLIRSKEDIKFTYVEICSILYLLILTLEFLSRIKQGHNLAVKYGKETANYVNYKEFKLNATDLYNIIYFVEESPANIERIFGHTTHKDQRMKTYVPRMELNRWLMTIDSKDRDLYFLAEIERALGITSTDLKDIRRILNYRNMAQSDVTAVASRILNVFRTKLNQFDIKPEIENILTQQDLKYIG